MKTSYETSIATAIAELRAAKTALSKEISRYPTPISGCDAQFNRLLSDRTRLNNALQAMAAEPFIPTPRMLEPVARTACV